MAYTELYLNTGLVKGSAQAKESYKGIVLLTFHDQDIGSAEQNKPQ